MQLYNTRTRRVEEFVPLRGNEVRIYVCGLTPSAEAHLGHARSFLFFDILRRYLIHRGYEVTYVQNVTDVDDRSIAAARESGEEWSSVVARHYTSFKRSMHRLEVREPDEEPYATGYVPQIVAMIERLIASGHAYLSQDGVYYRVASFSRYGSLANRRIDELEAGARIEVDEHKDDPLDFALWKLAKPGEPTWLSPWGDGRPGWHIECSAMSRELLDPPGEGFDIHGGGADLIFPHHENEIAQSEPLMGKPPMSNFWLHGGLLLFDGKKMSKSLGNFEPLCALLDRHDPQAVRLLFLQTGYRKVMNFTEAAIGAAATSLEKLKAAYRKLAAGTPGECAVVHGGLIERIDRALDDDMNTAAALSELHAFAANADVISPPERETALAQFEYALYLLGLRPNAQWLQTQKASLPPDLPERLHAMLGSELALNGSSPEQAIDQVIAIRARARANKDWATSDRLRAVLARCGVVLEDGKEGTTWSAAR